DGGFRKLGAAAALSYPAAGRRALDRRDARSVQSRRRAHRGPASGCGGRRPARGRRRRSDYLGHGRDRPGRPDGPLSPRVRRLPMRPTRYARLVFVAWLVGSAAPLLAQNSQCAALSSADDSRQTCDAAVDLTRAYHPIAGLLISGGYPLLGSAASMGGLGKFALSLRANGAHIVIPDLSVDGSNNVAQSDELFAPAPLLEGAIGLFKGLPNGLLS